MSYSERIVEDMKAAMKAGESEKVGVLRMLRAAMLELAKSGEEVTEELELKALQKQAKMRKDSISQFEDAGREDLASKERAELEIVETYLPKQLSDDDIREKVRAIIRETGASGMDDFKLVMPKAMGSMKGLADGSRVQAIVKEALQTTEG